ncbi:Lrp/AsnC ligand binding domain-containing protein [Pontibacterium granulatum]|uniref:Lrp/AsnC ligand binding domain-containing protein n=1 Tax=Pontibacterium granulatum TaxID=2036029 RepID=UPI0031F32C60
MHIKTQHHDSAWLKTFAARVICFDEVVECYRMSGEWDYLLRVVVKDIETFDVFYKKLINDIDGLSNVTSSFAMEEIKYTTKLPVM